MEYKFNLKFKLAPEKTSDANIMKHLGEAGCTDALVGLGLAGYVGLDFIREADSAENAILSALADVKTALPMAKLVEVGPDFVGLTAAAVSPTKSGPTSTSLAIGRAVFTSARALRIAFSAESASRMKSKPT